MVGKIDDIRIYNCILDAKDLMILSRKKLQFVDVPFNVVTPTRQYIEEIDKIAAHRVPGFKSNTFNIKIINSSSYNDNIKAMIENSICGALSKVTPIGSKLNKIQWE
jgi:hypothetical protein